jgi:hypothetical protein
MRIYWEYLTSNLLFKAEWCLGRTYSDWFLCTLISETLSLGMLWQRQRMRDEPQLLIMTYHTLHTLSGLWCWLLGPRHWREICRDIPSSCLPQCDALSETTKHKQGSGKQQRIFHHFPIVSLIYFHFVCFCETDLTNAMNRIIRNP